MLTPGSKVIISCWVRTVTSLSVIISLFCPVYLQPALLLLSLFYYFIAVALYGQASVLLSEDSDPRSVLTSVGVSRFWFCPGSTSCSVQFKDVVVREMKRSCFLQNFLENNLDISEFDKLKITVSPKKIILINFLKRFHNF